MADIAAVTAALQDLLGTDVMAGVDGNPKPCWKWGNLLIEQDGSIGFVSAHFSAWTLDKLHAASQIVRRMVKDA